MRIYYRILFLLRTEASRGLHFYLNMSLLPKRCVRNRRPVFLSKGKATNVPHGAPGMMYRFSYDRTLIELGAVRK